MNLQLPQYKQGGTCSRGVKGLPESTGAQREEKHSFFRLLGGSGSALVSSGLVKFQIFLRSSWHADFMKLKIFGVLWSSGASNSGSKVAQPVFSKAWKSAKASNVRGIHYLTFWMAAGLFILLAVLQVIRSINSETLHLGTEEFRIWWVAAL